MNLTINEAIALNACLNYSDRESQHSDNYSNGCADDFRLVLGWNGQQVGGLIASLTEKGLITDDGETDICWLTTLGVDTIFDYIEANGVPTV